MWVSYGRSDGVWQVELQNLEIFIRNCCYSKALLDNSGAQTEMNFFGPNTTQVVVDWPQVRADRDQQAGSLLDEFLDRLDAGFSGAQLQQLLIDMRDDALDDDKAYIAKMRDAQSQTMAAIQSSVTTGQDAEAILVAVRDLSGTVLLGGVTVISGGTLTAPALALLGAGMAIKGAGKYEDTGNVGSATFTAVSEGTISLIGLGGAAPGISQGAKSAMLLVGISGKIWSSAVSGVIDGKSVNGRVATTGFQVAAGQAFREGASQAFRNSPCGLVVSGVISVGSKILAGQVIERINADGAISDAKNAPWIPVSEQFLALSPSERFIRDGVMRPR